MENIVYTMREIGKALEELKSVAESKRISAAMNGSWGDGGASDLLEKIEIFETVWDGFNIPENRIPKFIYPYIENIRKKSDPDWETYQKLKQKFEK
jgi:hypothetical protein